MAVIAGARLALAETHEDCPSGPFAVHLNDAPFVGPQRDEFMTQLRTALRVRGVDVCAGPRATLREAIATVEITNEGDTRFVIVVKHAGFTKLAERTADLASLPPDGRPLALALATDELVRASWPELQVSDVQHEKPALPEVQTAIAPEPAAWGQTAPRLELGACGSEEFYMSGSAQLGGDLFAILWLAPQLGIDARAGVRAAVATVPVRQLRSPAVVIAIGPTFGLLNVRKRVGLDLGEQLVIVRLPAIGSEDASAAIYLRSRLRGWIATRAGLLLFAEAGGGAPVSSVAAAGVDGMQLSATLGVAGVF